MAFKIPIQAYTGTIRPVTFDNNGSSVTVGGETAFPFYTFEGEIPHIPRIAIQVPDFTPEDWADACLEPYKDVVGNPVAWAKKAQDVYKADIIFLWLKSTDPNGLNRSAEEASETTRKVLEAIDIPLIVWGSANVEKDTEVLRQVAMVCGDKKICIGPVEEANHKQIGAQALAYKHMVAASSPIDINLAKQLNILLGNLGVPEENIIIDPTTGALGYGIEYCYSVMERIRQAALTQQDEKLQSPIINILGEEVWKCREAKQSLEEAPTLGDPARRGIMLESVAAVAYLMAGSDVLVFRHPESVKLVKEFIGLMTTGDPAISSDKLAAKLNAINVKPEGDFPKIKKIEVKVEPKEEKKEKKKASKVPPKAEAKPAEAKPKVKEEKKVVEKPRVEEAKVGTKAEEEAKVEVKAKAKAEEVVKRKTEEEARAKAEAEAKAKAEEEAKKKAEEEAKAKAKAKTEEEAKARAEEVAKREAEEERLREQRAKEKEELLARRAGEPTEEISMTAAAVQKTELKKILEKLNRIHRRNID